MIKRNTKFNVIMLSVLAVFFMSNRGGSPGGRSGSTTDNGATCSTNGGCHNASGPSKQDILSTNVPLNGYAPGSTYDITVNVSDEGTSVWGFEMMAEDQNGSPVGAFSNNTQVNSLNGGLRATHKFASSSANNAQTWVANWTAPTSGTGSVTFYVAAMAAKQWGYLWFVYLAASSNSYRNRTAGFQGLGKRDVWPGQCRSTTAQLSLGSQTLRRMGRSSNSVAN